MKTWRKYGATGLGLEERGSRSRGVRSSDRENDGGVSCGSTHPEASLRAHVMWRVSHWAEAPATLGTVKECSRGDPSTYQRWEQAGSDPPTSQSRIPSVHRGVSSIGGIADQRENTHLLELIHHRRRYAGKEGVRPEETEGEGGQESGAGG